VAAPVARSAHRSRLLSAYVWLLATLAVVFAGTHLGQVREAATTKPAFWLMTALALLAASRAFVTSGTRGTAVVICPTLCFTFAILLCWGLGPAIVVQLAAIVVVALRLRHTFGQAALVAGQYALSFAATYAILVLGDPEPFADSGPVATLRDAASVVAAILAWLAVYCGLVVVAARLRWGAAGWRRATGSLGFLALYKAALLMLSPVVAVTAHVNAAFVVLTFVPLYAVERMARLSADRDQATRLDPVTGLANRAGLQARFEDLAATHPRMALLLLDLDRFKHVNDTLGHEVGDRLLVAVGERLGRVVPDADVLARLGGDEFAVITTKLEDLSAACALASRVASTLAEPIRLDDTQVDITASVGIAVYPQDGPDFATLMRHADVAMYDAKQRGDTTAFYRPDADPNSPHRLGLLTDLRQALQVRERAELNLHYQPQVALDTGQVTGVEALLRWQHPTRGAVSPQELLHAAEPTGVMQMITARVIDDVTAQVARWRTAGLTLRASLNISARDLQSLDVVAQLSARLAEHDIPASQIQLEITESALMADPARALSTINQLSALGVPVALDDFGTGYSSLQNLRKLPFAEIKIDQSFVAGMAHNSDDAAIVRSTVELARALGLRTVAEGVETEYTWRMLADIGCSAAQGWFCARPMPATEVPAWLAQHAARLRLPARTQDERTTSSHR
jgi:diguanylate cyclase (GGDEF)-like protein